MENLGQKLVLNLKSRRYEVMDGTNIPDRIVDPSERISPSYNSETNGSVGEGHNNNEDTRSTYSTSSGKKHRDFGTDIEMTAAVSGVVPDG